MAISLVFEKIVEISGVPGEAGSPHEKNIVEQ